MSYVNMTTLIFLSILILNTSNIYTTIIISTQEAHVFLTIVKYTSVGFDVKLTLLS